jgi:hypothetical protein
MRFPLHRREAVENVSGTEPVYVWEDYYQSIRVIITTMVQFVSAEAVATTLVWN